MLSVKDLHRIVASMELSRFEAEMGPFALIQRPPDIIRQQKAMELGAKQTVALKKGLQPYDNNDLQLLVEFDDLSVATLPPLTDDASITVGRLPDCELVVDDPSVSKHHAKLWWDFTARRAMVEDLGSSNGTLINGDELHMPMQIRDGDTVTFGDAPFCLLHTSTLYALLVAGRTKKD